MSSGKNIPSFDFYKKLDSPQHFEFYKLEESYNAYDASHAHRHNYFEILYFEKSGGSHEIDFNSYPIKSHSIHFISPEQVHRLRREKNVTGYVLSFTTDFFLNDSTNISFMNSLPFFNNSDSLPVIRLIEKSSQPVIHDLILKIHNEYHSVNPDRMEMISSSLEPERRRSFRFKTPSSYKHVFNTP